MSIQFSQGSNVLPPGRHQATVEQIGAALVEAFPDSQTRRPIFDEWNQLKQRMSVLVPLRAQWLNGSYVTRKLDPGDIDLLTQFDALVFDALDSDDQGRFNDLTSGKRPTAPGCDSFALGAYPEGHELHDRYVRVAADWDYVFGHDDADNPRGYIEVDDECLTTPD